MSTITVYPSAVLESLCSYQSVDNSHPLANVIGKGVDSDTYAQWYMVTGGAALTKVYYSFDLSAIPTNATITSVTCQAKCQAQNSSAFRGGNNTLWLLSGDTEMAKTGGNQVFGTSATIVTLPDATWTREQLDDCRLMVQGARGYIGTSTAYYMRCYGAALTVSYEAPVAGTGLYFKSGGSYAEVQAVYRKENGVWVLQNNPAAVFDTSTSYVKG